MRELSPEECGLIDAALEHFAIDADPVTADRCDALAELITTNRVFVDDGPAQSD